MPYLGNEPAAAFTSTTKDSFSGDASTTDFTMSKSANVNAVRVVVENVVQNPTVAYTCSGTTLSFTSAPPTGTNNIYVVHLGPPAATVAPPSTINNPTTFTGGVTLKNETSEDTDGGRESIVTFQGTQSGSEISTLAQIQASHDGTSDDEKGDLIFRTNDGSDGTSPTERIRIDSLGHVGVNTSSPDANGFGAGNGILTVASDTGSAKTAMLNLVGDGNDTNATRVASLFFNDASATGAGSTLAGIEAYRASNHATDPGADLVFNTNIGSTGGYAEKMRIASDGVVTTPNQASFHVQLNTNQTGYNASASSGSQDHIEYDTEVYDTGNNISGGTFTAPADGVYYFRAEAYANVGWTQSWFLVNGARAAGTDIVYTSSTSFAHSSVILKLSENDTVEYRGYISGATNATIYANANHTWMRGHLIG